MGIVLYFYEKYMNRSVFLKFEMYEYEVLEATDHSPTNKICKSSSPPEDLYYKSMKLVFLCLMILIARVGLKFSSPIYVSIGLCYYYISIVVCGEHGILDIIE